MCSAVVDVQMIAKLLHEIFACVARDVMIENETNQPPFCFTRVDRVRVLHSQNERLGASLDENVNLQNHGKCKI